MPLIASKVLVLWTHRQSLEILFADQSEVGVLHTGWDCQDVRLQGKTRLFDVGMPQLVATKVPHPSPWNHTPLLLCWFTWQVNARINYQRWFLRDPKWVVLWRSQEWNWHSTVKHLTVWVFHYHILISDLLVEYPDAITNQGRMFRRESPIGIIN